MLNVITKEKDRLLLHGFHALSHSAVIKYGDDLMVIDARPCKSLKYEYQVVIEDDRTIRDENALLVAESMLTHKNTLFIEVEELYYIQDTGFVMSDDWKPEE